MDPFWGPQSSHLNFCEQDYAITRYIAEFINTLSSFSYVIYGSYGLFNRRVKRSSPLQLLSYCGLIGVGLCSAGYHMTMKYHTQMSDELSMHLLTTPLVYRLTTFKATPQRTKLIGWVLAVLFTTVMVTHMVMDEFLLHATTFGLAVYIIATRVLRLIPDQVPDPRIRKTLKRIALFGVVCFVFGYLVWLIDELVCNALTNLKDSVGLPFAFILELHGWWHFFTSIGGYIAVALVDAITSGEVRKDPTPRLAFPVPLVARLLSSPEKASGEKLKG